MAAEVAAAEAVVGEEAPEDMAAAEAAGEVAGAGEDAMATGFALTRAVVT